VNWSPIRSRTATLWIFCDSVCYSIYYSRGIYLITQTRDRLFDSRSAFISDPLVVDITLGVVALLAIAPLLFLLLGKAGKAGEKLLKDLWQRWIAWLILVPLIGLPVSGIIWASASTSRFGFSAPIESARKRCTERNYSARLGRHKKFNRRGAATQRIQKKKNEPQVDTHQHRWRGFLICVHLSLSVVPFSSPLFICAANKSCEHLIP
jgi:hypothetical protein